MKHILYISLAFLSMFGTACRKYVEIPPEQVRELKYTKDYQALLYNFTLIEKGYFFPILASDDVGSDDARWQNSLTAPMGTTYTWKDRLFEAGTEDLDWSGIYKAIYPCNQVITNVMTSVNGTEQQKINAYASALVHRAYFYYMLVNTYAKQYDPATAATDPGVPLVLGIDFFSDLNRGTVAKVFDQITADLQQAMPNLPAVPDFTPNPSKGAANALLAKIYLDKRAFPEAERYADSALKYNNGLVDLNSYIVSTTAYPRKLADPELIFSKMAMQAPISLPMSADLLSRIDVRDLRYKLLTKSGAEIGNYFNTRGYWKYKITNEGLCVGPTVPEMMLIKAECEARANRPAEAVTILNTLRKKRFVPADYSDLPVTTGQAALELVINERRVELMGRGTRWFDQRRLQKDAPNANFVTTVTRTFKSETFTLAPGSNRYVFPVADKYIEFNPEIVQNPR